MKDGKNKLERLQSLLFSLILIFSIMITGGSQVLATSSSTGKMIKDLNTDKSMYNPGDIVKIYLDIKNDTEDNI